MQTIQDTIERSVTLTCDRREIIQAFADPNEVVKWFCDSIEGSWCGGNEVLLVWEEGRCRAKIEAIDEHRFAFRWFPGVSDPDSPITQEGTTLNEFSFSEDDGATRIQMIESEFVALSEENAQIGLAENSKGWDWEMNDLKNYLEKL